jgi:hypothetical protein
MIRSRASVPMAENISAYFVTCSAPFFGEAICIFPQLQKYQENVKE